MSVRETLNNNPMIVGIVVVVIVALALFMFIGQSDSSASSSASAYFSDDDGKSWFSGDVMDVPPIDHKGKQAMRAYLYRCPDGKKFVGYLEKYPEDIVTLMKKANADAKALSPEERSKLMNAVFLRQVKKPGDSAWQKAPPQGPEVKCPDGSPATPVG